jgi:GNAT superfamily N-acetyltransferase
MSEVAQQDGFFDSKTYVAYDGDHILGFVSHRDHCISWLYVDPDHCRQGIGRMLLVKAIECCGPHAWTHMLAVNVAALHHYTTSGLGPVKTFASKRGIYPCQCMRLALPTSRMYDPEAK